MQQTKVWTFDSDWGKSLVGHMQIHEWMSRVIGLLLLGQIVDDSLSRYDDLAEVSGMIHGHEQFGK